MWKNVQNKSPTCECTVFFIVLNGCIKGAIAKETISIR